MGEDPVTPDHQRHLRSGLMPYGGEFQGHIPGSDDQGPFAEGLEVKCPVGIDDTIAERYAGQGARAGTHGQNRVAGGQPADSAVRGPDRNQSIADDGALSLNKVHLSLGQQLGKPTGHGFDHLILVGGQALVVDALCLHLDSHGFTKGCLLQYLCGRQ